MVRSSQAAVSNSIYDHQTGPFLSFSTHADCKSLVSARIPIIKKGEAPAPGCEISGIGEVQVRVP